MVDKRNSGTEEFYVYLRNRLDLRKLWLVKENSSGEKLGGGTGTEERVSLSSTGLIDTSQMG